MIKKPHNWVRDHFYIYRKEEWDHITCFFAFLLLNWVLGAAQSCFCCTVCERLAWVRRVEENHETEFNLNHRLIWFCPVTSRRHRRNRYHRHHCASHHCPEAACERGLQTVTGEGEDFPLLLSSRCVNAKQVLPLVRALTGDSRRPQREERFCVLQKAQSFSILQRRTFL